MHPPFVPKEDFINNFKEDFKSEDSNNKQYIQYLEYRDKFKGYNYNIDINKN